MNNLFETRVQKLQSQLKLHQAAFLSDPQDIYYFCGFEALLSEERESFLLISPTTVTLLYTSFSPTPEYSWLAKLAQVHPAALKKHLETIIKTQPKLTQLLIDEGSLYVSEYQALHQVEGITLSEWNKSEIWRLRALKDSSEIRSLTTAGHIVSQALTKVINHLKVGITELELQEMLETEMKKHGSQRVAFPTIVAFGIHTAYPHHQPGSTKLKNNMPVLIDCGATSDNYRSDMTRTVWFGKQPDPEFLKIETIVKQAYKLATESLQNSAITAQEIDKITRDFITQQGYGSFFIHTTGHGVGIGIHESPSLNWQNQTKIEPGMVITIEPGIYLDDSFGYRYENTIVVTDKGEEELTNS